MTTDPERDAERLIAETEDYLRRFSYSPWFSAARETAQRVVREARK